MEIWPELVAREGGPMSFRFVLQPCVATVLAVRAGLRDAREGRPGYLWSILTEASRRGALFREGWEDVSGVFILAFVLDCVYQLREDAFRPRESLFVAGLLALVPYAAVRALTGRLARRRS